MKPSFTQKLKFQSVIEGDPVELKCKLVACPPPTILWFHNNRPIRKERRRRIFSDSRLHMHVTSLVIDCIKEKDSGSYKVMAINTEGSAESTASLLVSLREEQSANYLGFARRSAKAHESVDTMAEERKERKFRVDLRCVGSPFDKMSKVHQGRSRSKNAVIRTVYFRSSTPTKEKQSEKESKHLETASERAPSPPPMFERPERFNDRFSDIYCDRRTGARFSDKFSDRCSDRYSERFSDTESLHNEVRTKLTTLQKAVKQRKRFSISTMSSSEFDLESVASEPSYADYVEKLRVRPASLQDVPHFNRPFDLGESQKEIPGKTAHRESSQPRVRHSFEPQSRTRAIQIMRGELVDTMMPHVDRKSDGAFSETLRDKKAESFVESPIDVGLKESSEGVSAHKVEATKMEIQLGQSEVPYSETYPETTTYTESRECVATRENRLKLVASSMGEWQQESRMEETFHPETDLPLPAGTPYMEPEGHIYTQHEMVERRLTEVTETMPPSFHKSPRMKARVFDPEAATVPIPKSPRVRSAVEETDVLLAHQESPRIKSRTAEVEARVEAKMKESPRPRPHRASKASVLTETSTPDDKITEAGDRYEEECEEESLRAHYEKTLEAERMECEEKLLALRIRKWQQGMVMSEEDTFHPETDLPSPAETPYMEPYTQQEVVEKLETDAMPSSVHKSPRIKTRAIDSEVPTMTAPESPKVKGTVDETEVLLAQQSPRTSARTAEAEAKESLRSRPIKTIIGDLPGETVIAGDSAIESADAYKEQCVGESLRAHYGKSLEAAQMECEEKLLALRIRKWQQGMVMSDEDTFHPETDLPSPTETPYMEPEGHIYTQQEMVEKRVTEALPPSIHKSPIMRTRPIDPEATTMSAPKSPKLKGGVGEDEALHSSFHKSPRIKVRAGDLEAEGLVKQTQVSPRIKGRASEMEVESLTRTKARQEKMLFEKTKEDRELQLSRENISELQQETEQFVSEEEALTQRIMKWQQGVMEQQQSVKLEPDSVEGYAPFKAETTTEVRRDIKMASASESQTEAVLSRKPGKTAKEKFLTSEPVSVTFQDQQHENYQLPTEGRETRLQRDSEYFVNEEEALAQRILKWQQDVVEQEEVTELESEWALDSQGKQPFEPQVPSFDRSEPAQAQPSHDLPTLDKTYMATVAGDVPFERAPGLPSTPAKGRMGPEASSAQISSDTQLEGYELTSAPGKGPIKPSREASLIRQHSSQEDLGREAQGTEEYAMIIDKSSSQRFQSDVREEGMGRREEMGTTRDWGQMIQQKDSAGVSGERRVESEEVKIQNVDSHLKETEESKRIKDRGAKSLGSPPVCMKDISPVKVKIGEMSEFCCQFQGEPVPTVTWLKDGHPLAHNPDYDIVSKSNYSKLTVFYPTTDHEGTYDCVLTNKHGKCTCSATLEISDKKVVRTSEVVVTEEPEKCQETQEGHIEDELQSYTDTGKATLRVPQMVIHQRHASEESFSSSPVEIRITAATPIPELAEEKSVEKPPAVTETPSDVPMTDDATSQMKHKFTFSFDATGGAPNVVRELENITCSDGSTAVLECEISGDPTPEATWYYDEVSLNFATEKYQFEVEDKVYRLYINSFTYSDAGVYKCVARNKMGEVTSIADVSFQVAEPGQFSEFGDSMEGNQRVRKPHDIQTPVVSDKAAIANTDDGIVEMGDKPVSSTEGIVVKPSKSRSAISREPPILSGCGLTASAAVIKVSQIKQAFESDSPAALMMPPEEQRKQTFFPEEFIPEVVNPFDKEEQVPGPVGGEEGAALPEIFPLLSKPISLGGESEIYKKSVEEGALQTGIHTGVKQFVEEVPESPELVRPKPQRPEGIFEQIETGEGEAREEVMRTFERTSSFIPFQSEKGFAAKPTTKLSTAPSGELSRPKRISEPVKPEGKSVSVASSLARSEAVEVPSYSEDDGVAQLTEIEEEKEIVGEIREELPLKPVSKEVISIPEPSMDSGVFLSMPDSQADVTEGVEGSVVKPHVELKGEDESTDIQVEAKPEPLIVKATAESKIKVSGLSETMKPGVPVHSRARLEWASPPESGAAAATVGSMEEEEVTFGAVYDYYNPPTDWGRPLSPESEMSIEIGSTMSEEIPEAAERFYTPGSSTEVSQPIAESFHTPKSPVSLHTRSSDSPGGFTTPQEFPFSPIEHKRPSTGDSTEKFFSPVQFLTSPADEGIETAEISVDESRFLSGRGSLGLGTLQEKVQGIPPAFLKPLIKKRVFENETLKFFAEVFGLPSPEVKWFCNKTQLVAGDRVQMERDGDSISLIIHNVTKADQGEYICEAVNYVGEARSVALVVVVSQEVRFMPAPPTVTHQHVMEFDVEEDDSSRSPSPQEILLEVELDENEVKEFEKQVKIITIPEYTADNKSMIISLDVLPSIYEEGAVDFVTQEHDDLKIAFEVTEMPPRFINPICDMETPEGTTVMFECSLMGIPSPIVSWFKGDKKIPHNKKFLHSSDGDNHFLKICKVTSQDSGVYTCRAINVVGETLCRASLIVLSGKAFAGKTRGRELTAVSLGSAKVQPQKFDLMVGNTSFDGEQVSEIELEFEFEQEADESQRAVRLVANTDNETSEQGEKYVSINFDVFAEPAKDDKIEFKGKSSDMCSFQFQVTETAPKCVIPLTNVTAAAGTPVILQCLVSGKPNPTAEWFKDGESVTDSRCIIQEKTAGHFNLLITNVNQDDAGEYKCVIQNTAGCIETTALLKVF